MNEKQQTRDRVRALVREVLENTPVEGEAPPAKIIEMAPSVEVQETEYDRDESAKTLITEDDLRGLETGAKLRIAENTRFTPLASDVIRDKQIQLIEKTSRVNQAKVRTIAVAADHGGFETKEKLKEFLIKQDLQIRDYGTNSAEAVDYPDFAAAVAKAVAEKQVDVGIIIDGAGIGSAISANKIPGVRAAACYNQALAKNSREHNGANVLSLGSKQNTFAEICEIVTTFLSSELTEDRHRKRIAKIEAIEQQYQR